MSQLDVLVQFCQESGHSDISYTEIYRDTPIGAVASIFRRKYRSHQLGEDTIRRLESLPGWSWEQRQRGRKVPRGRDTLILKMRQSGYSLEQIGAQFGLSKQRIHQIIKGHQDDQY